MNKQCRSWCLSRVLDSGCLLAAAHTPHAPALLEADRGLLVSVPMQACWWECSPALASAAAVRPLGMPLDPTLVRPARRSSTCRAKQPDLSLPLDALDISLPSGLLEAVQEPELVAKFDVELTAPVLCCAVLCCRRYFGRPHPAAGAVPLRQHARHAQRLGCSTIPSTPIPLYLHPLAFTGRVSP